MKILVLATPRSGSTSLTKLINAHLNPDYSLFIEPFNPNFYQLYKNKGFDFQTIIPLQNCNNLLVKTLLLVENNEYPLKSFNSSNSYFDWCISFFDKIILLDRIDKLAQSESFAFNETMFRKYGIDWHTPKKYNIAEIDSLYIQNMVDRYTASAKLLSSISIKCEQPIFYYEDIFESYKKGEIEKIFNYLKINLIDSYYNEFILSQTKKVRIQNTLNKII